MVRIFRIIQKFFLSYFPLFLLCTKESLRQKPGAFNLYSRNGSYYDRNWDLDNPEVVQLLKNTITYALIRNDYRNYTKRKRWSEYGLQSTGKTEPASYGKLGLSFLTCMMFCGNDIQKEILIFPIQFLLCLPSGWLLNLRSYRCKFPAPVCFRIDEVPCQSMADPLRLPVVSVLYHIRSGQESDYNSESASQVRYFSLVHESQTGQHRLGWRSYGWMKYS